MRANDEKANERMGISDTPKCVVITDVLLMP